MPPTAATGKKTGVPCLLLTQNAEIKEIVLQVPMSGGLTLANLKTTFKKKDVPDLLGSYPLKSSTLFLFGYTKGKDGTENKHELPPPHDAVGAFGDILLLASKDPESWSFPIPFKSAEYETFYTRAFGGFDEDEEEEGEGDIAEGVELEEADAADAAVEEDAEEEAEEAEEEEEAEEDVEVEADAGEDAEETPIPVRRVRAAPGATVAKAKKRKPAAAAATTEAAAYLHVPPAEALKQEDWVTPPQAAPTTRRATMVARLYKLTKDHLSYEDTLLLERCIYNATVRMADQRHVGLAWSYAPFVQLYEMTARHITSNLIPTSYVGNTELLERIKKGYISWKELSEMNVYELYEGHWKESFIQQQLREKRQLEGNRAMATDRFTCTRCWKKECTYYELQTRSADEPMTIFITCLNCGKHWRQ